MNKTINKRKIKCFILNLFIYVSVISITAFIIFILGYIFYRGGKYINLDFLTSSPSFINDTIGIFPNILNTIYVIIITLFFVLPLGVSSAIYLNEYNSNKKIIKYIELSIETLAGIPSIIYGLVGMLIFVEFFHIGTSILAGSLTLTIMTLPTIIRTVEESLKKVPMSYREGALALGSSKWHMIKTIIIPTSFDGIITGVILSIGRIVGESAALLFTAGMANEVISFFEALRGGFAGSTLTVALYMYAKERGDFNTSFAIAVILLILILLINFLILIISNVYKKKGAIDE